MMLSKALARVSAPAALSTRRLLSQTPLSRRRPSVPLRSRIAVVRPCCSSPDLSSSSAGSSAGQTVTTLPKDGQSAASVSTTVEESLKQSVGQKTDAASEDKTGSLRVTAYPFPEIEAKWQAVWEEKQTFRTPGEVDTSKPKYYVLDMFPYPR